MNQSTNQDNTNLSLHNIFFKVLCLVGDPEHGYREGQIQHHLITKEHRQNKHLYQVTIISLLDMLVSIIDRYIDLCIIDHYSHQTTIRQLVLSKQLGTPEEKKRQ